MHTPDSTFWAADLGDVDRAVAVALEAWDHFGGLDALVNNAAIGEAQARADAHAGRRRRDDAHQLPLARPHGRWRCSPAGSSAAPGSIVNVSSMGGRLGILHEAAYSASKFALCGWSESDAHGPRRHRRRR